MPQYIRIAVIALSSAVISSQAFAQGNSNQSNGVPHVIEEALANGINVEVTNESPIEVTVSNFPDTSGGGDDESGYVGLSSVAMTGAGGLTGKVMQCQADFGSVANICGDSEIMESHKLTTFAADLESSGESEAWVRPELVAVRTYERNVSYPVIRYFRSTTVNTINRGIESNGVCSSGEDKGRNTPVGVVLSSLGNGNARICTQALPVACCR